MRYESYTVQEYSQSFVVVVVSRKILYNVTATHGSSSANARSFEGA
jgi:hypothetical protein